MRDYGCTICLHSRILTPLARAKLKVMTITLCFAGVGSGQGTLEQFVELASRPQVAQQWRKCHHLIIDEISMVDGEFFDKLETVAR